MNSYHLLTTLRLHQPTTEGQLSKLFSSHGIKFDDSSLKLALQCCHNKEYNQVLKILGLKLNYRSHSPKKRNLRLKLEPLCQIFDQMDLLRQKNTEIEPQQRSSVQETNQELGRMRLEAESHLKSFINEARLDSHLMKQLEVGILKFQDERIRQNEEQGRVGAQKALERLRQTQKVKELKMLQEISFCLSNDDNFVRASRICSVLQHKPPKRKSTNWVNESKNTMSQLHSKLVVDQIIEEDGWCYSKKKCPSLQVVVENKTFIHSLLKQNNEVMQQMKSLQIIRNSEYHNAIQYNREKDVIIRNSKFKNLKQYNIPLIVVYDEQQSSEHHCISQIIGDNYMVMLNVHQDYDIDYTQFQDKMIIVSEIIQNINYSNNQRYTNGFIVGDWQRVRMEFDRIIIVPFNIEQIDDLVDIYTKELLLRQRSVLFNIVSSYLGQLDQVNIIFPSSIPVTNILQVIELVLQLRMEVYSSIVNNYLGLVLKLTKIYNSYGIFTQFIITFQLQPQQQKEILAMLHDKLGADGSSIVDKLRVDILIQLLMDNKQLNSNIMKLLDSPFYNTLKNQIARSNSSSQFKDFIRITSPALSYDNINICQSNDDNSFQCVPQPDNNRDSYFE